MTNKNIYLDIHVIQTVPSSNINRDDNGSPKTAMYGGVTRARVSSQSWKHAMRHDFNQRNQDDKGFRTKDAFKSLVVAIKELNSELTDEEVATKAHDVFATAGVKLDSKTDQTKALLMISQGQINKLAEYSLSHETLDKKELKTVFNSEQSLDLALFGRMVADNPELNVEGSAQVAHAISTHMIIPEFDYFTAVDDLQPEDNAGAAMLGVIEYNSATLYRYANLNINELIANLGTENAVEGALQYVRSFVLCMPTGKQNTFANKTLPSYVMVTLRDDTPVNLASAFEEPVESNTGYVKPSIKQLENEFGEAEQYVDPALLTLILSKTGSSIGEQETNLTVLLDQLESYLEKVVEDEDTND